LKVRVGRRILMLETSPGHRLRPRQHGAVPLLTPGRLLS